MNIVMLNLVLNKMTVNLKMLNSFPENIIDSKCLPIVTLIIVWRGRILVSLNHEVTIVTQWMNWDIALYIENLWMY